MPARRSSIINGEKLAGELRKRPMGHGSRWGKHGRKAHTTVNSPRVFGTTMKARRGRGARWSRRWLLVKIGDAGGELLSKMEGKKGVASFFTYTRSSTATHRRRHSSGRRPPWRWADALCSVRSERSDGNGLGLGDVALRLNGEAAHTATLYRCVGVGVTPYPRTGRTVAGFHRESALGTGGRGRRRQVGPTC